MRKNRLSAAFFVTLILLSLGVTFMGCEEDEVIVPDEETTSGFRLSQTEYYVDGILVETAVVSYNSDNKVSEVVRTDEELNELYTKEIFSYDGNDVLIEQYEYDEGDWNLWYTYEFTFDNEDREIKRMYKDWDDNQWKEAGEVILEYTGDFVTSFSESYDYDYDGVPNWSEEGILMIEANQYTSISIDNINGYNSYGVFEFEAGKVIGLDWPCDQISCDEKEVTFEYGTNDQLSSINTREIEWEYGSIVEDEESVATEYGYNSDNLISFRKEYSFSTIYEVRYEYEAGTGNASKFHIEDEYQEEIDLVFQALSMDVKAVRSQQANFPIKNRK